MSSSPKFQVEEQVYSKRRQRQGRIVASPTLIAGQWHYRVDLGTGVPVTLSERDLEPAPSSLDRLAAGDYGFASDFDLLAQATALSFAYRYEGWSCLSNSRLEPKPYQVFVAHRALQDLHPRYLLADEVGLGKTIEAGLILKELKARGLADRVLIVVPASLRDQWEGEMEVKFNERFHRYDGGTIRENLRRNQRSNPWERDNNIITSLQFARQQTRQANQPTGRRRGDEEQENRWIDQVDWDLVIFDEAHHLRRYLKGSKLDSGQEVTKSYRLGQALAERTKSLLLLTATPMQLSPYETYSLVELLDTGLFSSYSEFLSSKSQTDHIVKLDRIIRNLDWDTQLDSEEARSQLREELTELHVAWWALRLVDKEYEMWSGLTDCCLETVSVEQKERAQSAVERLTRLSCQVCDVLDAWLILNHRSFVVEPKQLEELPPFTRTEAEAKVGSHVRTRIAYRDPDIPKAYRDPDIPKGTDGEVDGFHQVGDGYHVSVFFFSDDLFAGERLSRAEYDYYLIDYGKVPPWEEHANKIDTILQEFISFIMEYHEAFNLWVERQHKLSQIMIRNRKREVLKGEFVKRKAHKIQVDLTPEERELYDAVSAYIKESYTRITGQTMALGFVLTTFRKLLVSSRHALAASLERRAKRIEDALHTGQKSEKDLSDDELEERAETLESIEDIDDLLSLTGGLSPAEAQAEINNLRDLAARARAIRVDSKADRLFAAVKPILDDDPTEKVLIFTQFRETQSYLQRLFEKEGFQAALFHGEYGSSSYSKRAESERFKKDPAVRIMLSTEVGGEGLNFQFCHVMFNYDLPWNPMRIEQRIGRLDRIGQKRDVHIYNFFLQGTLDARILTVLQDRIRLFEETIGNLDPIIGEDVKRDIKDIMLSDEAEAEQKLTDFEELYERRVHEAREAEAKMDDFIMDARSFRRDTVDEILGRKPPISNKDIEALTRTFLGRYPHETIKREADDVYTINVPPPFREDCRQLYDDIRLYEEYTGTFDPKTAIEEDTIDFFAFGHPLFDAIIRYCTDCESNSHFDPQIAQRVLHHSDYAGYDGVQFNYVLTLDGVRTYKKLIPIVHDLDGAYDEKLSHLIFSLSADEQATETLDVNLSATTLQNLERQSQAIVEQIAKQEMEEARKRNAQGYNEIREKLVRLFDYRLRNQQEELKQRQARLEDARQKGQKRILPALEGQVRATERRISDLEQQHDSKLAELQKKRDVNLSIELLNVALVVFKNHNSDHEKHHQPSSPAMAQELS